MGAEGQGKVLVNKYHIYVVEEENNSVLSQSKKEELHLHLPQYQ